jgi:hypothetical protein
MVPYTHARSDSVIGFIPRSVRKNTCRFVCRGFKVAVFSVLFFGYWVIRR